MMIPVFIKVTLLGGNREKRIVNSDQIQMISEKLNDMTGDIHSQIKLDGAIMNVEESPDQIKEMIIATFRSNVADIIKRLHGLGFIGH